MFYKHCFGITGLEYLHYGCNPSIIHHDVKTSNILFPSDMKNGKLANFGLLRLTNGENITHIITNVMRTTGYLDHEWVFKYFFLNNISNNHMIMCDIDYIN